MSGLFLMVARNSFLGAFSRLSIKLISFAFTIFIIRWLGDEGYGHYSLIWSYVMIFSMLSDAGLGMYAIREIAKKQTGSQYITGNIIVIRLILASITMVILMVTAWALGNSGQFLLNLFLASTILLLYAVQDPLDVIFQANERFDVSAIITLLGQLVFVSVGIVLLLANWYITGLIIAGLLNIGVSALLAWYGLADYRQDLQWRLKPALWPGFIRASLPFGLVKLWLSWSLKLDIIILSWFWTYQVVGWYSAAYAIILGFMVISNSINAAIYPALSRQYSQDESSLSKICGLTLKYLLLISLPIAVGVFLNTDKVISLLYGREFSSVTPALKILIWVLPLTFISEFLRYTLLVTNQERAVVRALGFSILLTLGLNLWLIPIYSLLAASIIAVVIEAMLVFLYTWQLSPMFKEINLSDILLKPFLAALFLLIAAYAIIPSSLLWQITLGGLVYLFFIWLLRAIKPNEYKLLFHLLTKPQEKLFNFTKKKEAKVYPFVSVFIPTYNAGQFLAQAIDSVLGQTYQNYELIIIDDGSTDNTVDILEHYHNHPQVVIHRNPKNVGLGPNWNIGLSLCRGELIAKLDADDYYEPDYLEAVVEVFQKHPTVGLVFSGLNLIYPDGRCEAEMPFLHSWVYSRETFLPILLQLCVVRSPTVCVRHTCYDQLGKFIEQMSAHSDWEMWVRIAANYPVGFIARKLAIYRMSYGSNHTVESTLDGRSMHDLRLWLQLLEQDALPYRLNTTEQTRFRWGIYALEMHFAALAAHYNRFEMQQAYIDFAEEVLPNRLNSSEIKKLRQVNLNLHQGIHAFREKHLKEARHYFWQAIKTGPTYCKSPWIWSKLLLTFIGRTKWGIMYK